MGTTPASGSARDRPAGGLCRVNRPLPRPSWRAPVWPWRRRQLSNPCAPTSAPRDTPGVIGPTGPGKSARPSAPGRRRRRAQAELHPRFIQLATHLASIPGFLNDNINPA